MPVILLLLGESYSIASLLAFHIQKKKRYRFLRYRFFFIIMLILLFFHKAKMILVFIIPSRYYFAFRRFFRSKPQPAPIQPNIRIYSNKDIRMNDICMLINSETMIMITPTAKSILAVIDFGS